MSIAKPTDQNTIVGIYYLIFQGIRRENSSKYPFGWLSITTSRHHLSPIFRLFGSVRGHFHFKLTPYLQVPY
jgi:hypothetical protein